MPVQLLRRLVFLSNHLIFFITPGVRVLEVFVFYIFPYFSY